MASSTTNINLTLPVGSEKVSRQVINDNNTKIDNAIGALPSGQNLQGEIDALNGNIASKEFNPSANASLISWIVANVPDRSCLPFSFQKIGNNQLSDVPFATATTEFAGIVTGNGDRLVVELNRFSSSGYQKFTRTVFQNNWYGNWEEWALKSAIPTNVTFKNVSNVNNFTVDLGYTPSASNYGQLIVFNANQGSLNMIAISGTLNVTKVIGNITLTPTVSGQSITVQASGTLWGDTVVMISHN